jgi:hypothetical protein
MIRGLRAPWIGRGNLGRTWPWLTRRSRLGQFGSRRLGSYFEVNEHGHRVPQTPSPQTRSSGGLA